MMITLEPTTVFSTVNGVRARIWQGHTSNGTPIHAHIVTVGVDRNEDSRELDAILTETVPAATAYPLRMLIPDDR